MYPSFCIVGRDHIHCPTTHWHIHITDQYWGPGQDPQSPKRAYGEGLNKWDKWHDFRALGASEPEFKTLGVKTRDLSGQPVFI